MALPHHAASDTKSLAEPYRSQPEWSRYSFEELQDWVRRYAGMAREEADRETRERLRDRAAHYLNLAEQKCDNNKKFSTNVGVIRASDWWLTKIGNLYATLLLDIKAQL
jgi:hypothetical protein